MGDADRGQVVASAAEVYDSFFVPALFAQWTDIVLGAADVHAGHRVLDIGCGTGVLASAAASRVGPSGHVTGIDPNEGMLDVARRTKRPVEWKIAVAEDLPAADDWFDRVVSQFALMFFTDQRAALEEVARVTRPDGRIAFAVWDRFENNIGYARLASLIERLFGAESAHALRAPFALGDADLLTDIASNGIADPQVTSHRGTARFESLEAWLHTEIRGWTLADHIDDAGFELLVDAATAEMGDLAHDGGVSFDVSALVVSGRPAR